MRFLYFNRPGNFKLTTLWVDAVKFLGYFYATDSSEKKNTSGIKANPSKEINISLEEARQPGETQQKLL